MSQLLKQSTAYTFQLGPFVSSADGVTPMASLTIAATDVDLSKNGGAFADKTESTALTGTGDSQGYYDCVLDTTDTGTLGKLEVRCYVATALPVLRVFQVVPANVYDSLVAGSDYLDANTVQAAGTAWGSGAVTAASIANDAITADKIAAAAIDFATFAADCKTGTGLKANVESITASAIAAASFAAGAIDATAIANGAIDFATFAADCKTGTGLKANVESITNDAITTLSIANDAITAAKIAAAAIDFATFAADCKTGTGLKANVESVSADAITAASVAADVGPEIGTAVWAVAARTLTAATNITSTDAKVPITAGGYVSADIKAINATAVDGAGTVLDPWGPV